MGLKQAGSRILNRTLYVLSIHTLGGRSTHDIPKQCFQTIIGSETYLAPCVFRSHWCACEHRVDALPFVTIRLNVFCLRWHICGRLEPGMGVLLES